MKRIILSLLLIALTFSYTYKISSNSDCLQFDPTYKVCSQWGQVGTIEQDVSCFIGETLVKEMTKGYIQIKDVQEGDKIMTLKDGKEAWSTVEGWLHKSETFQGTYHNLTLVNDEWIGVSGKHNIAFKTGQELYSYGFPVDETSQKQLYPCSKKISSKKTFTATGKYALLTSESSYLVFTPKNFESILVHDFANIRNPESYEIPVKAFLGISKVFNGGHLRNAEGVHIGADWMMDKFSFLME